MKHSSPHAEQPALWVPFKDKLINWALKQKMRRAKRKLYEPFLKKMQDAQKAQAELLETILKENKETSFGKQHHFNEIKNYNDFQKKVPVGGYEDFREEIKKQDREQKPYLTQKMAFMYNQTSGTTGKPKYIPVLKDFLKAFQEQQELSAYLNYQAYPKAFEGKILAIVGPAVEGHLPSGAPYGSISGYIYKNYPKTIQSKYIVPSAIFELEDYELKYYLIGRLALEEENISIMATATPPTFYKVLDVIRTHYPQMIEEIETGTCKGLEQLEPETAKVIRKKLSPNPKRAEVLRKLTEEKNTWKFGDLWPHLKLLVTWIGSSSGISLKSLLKSLPEHIKVMDLGYISSEFRGTITLEAETNQGVPTLDQNFLEFVEAEKKEKGELEFKLLHELETGKQYYIFITTRTGLYRYDMNDIVEAGKRVGSTPLLGFVQKGKGVTNINQEKLHEAQVIETMEKAEEKFGLNVKFYQMLANQTEAGYELYLELKEKPKVTMEQLAHFVDEQLQVLNVVYKHRRKDGHLKPLMASLLKPGTFEEYKKHLVGKGQRESQFKAMLLQYKEQCDFDFGRHCEG